MPKRFRIKAWGHPMAPDLDFESDVEDFKWIGWHYPCMTVALQIPVSIEAISKALESE